MLQVVTEEPIEKITHYFAYIGVAAGTLNGELAVGDRVRLKGQASDLTETVESL